MKKLLLIPALILFLASCDLILKQRDDTEAEVNTNENVVLGNDKDEKGCVTSAGYKWSLLRKECIRVFEEGYRLNAVDTLKSDDMQQSAFVIFDKEATQAELYLPNTPKSILLKKQGDAVYKSGDWLLRTDSNYQLRKQGTVLYTAAVIKENRIIGDDWKGEGPAPAVNDSTN